MPQAARLLPGLLLADDGQGLVEYALVVALVAIVAVVGIRLFGSKVTNSLNNDATQIP